MALETRGMLEIHFIPPFAPDLNPDEFVWQYAKRNGVSKNLSIKIIAVQNKWEWDKR